MTITFLWEALKAERRTEAGWHIRRVDPQSHCDLFAALRQPGGIPGLLLEVPAEAVQPGFELPESRGFAVEAHLIGPSYGGTARFTLWLRDPAYVSIFPVLCENVAAVALAESSPDAALRAWIGRLHVWQEFMARHGPGGLTDEQALGLLGELVVLVEEIAPRAGLAPAIQCWAGPRGEPNDFELPRGFLEVKTTTRQASRSLQISNADQLDDSRGRIFLLHQRMRLDPEGLSLAEAVDVLRLRTASETRGSLGDLDQMLLQAGYIQAQASRYHTRFSRDGVSLFAVDDSFPRITRADLRAGVRDCTYVIDLASCSAVLAPEQALADLVRVGADG